MTTPPEPTPDRRGRLEVLSAGLLWSLGGVLIKSIALPGPVIAAARSLLAGLIFLPFVRRPPSRQPLFLVGSLLCYTGVVGLFVISTKLTTAANAIILQYTAPAFVFLIEILFRGARPDRRNVLTLAGGMSGIAVIWLGSSAGDLLGISLAVLSGVFFAVWMVLAAAARDVDAVSLTAFNNLGAGLLLLPLAVRDFDGPWQWRSLLLLLLMATIQLGLPYLLFTRGVKHVSSQEASLIVLVEPVLNPLWVAIVIGEIPSPATMVGGALILLTLLLRYLWPVRSAT